MSIHARHPGFTLIELLVVISIISLLIALLLPALASARSVTEITQCLSIQRQLGIANVNYTQDNSNTMPLAFFDADGSGPTASISWPNVAAYDGANPQTNPYFGYLPLTTSWDGPFTCPTYYKDGILPRKQGTGVTDLRVTYTYNFRLGAAISSFPYFFWQYRPVKIDSVQKQSERAYLIDGTYRSATRLDYAVTQFVAPETVAQSSPMNRHFQKTNNLLFFDGHADNRTGAEIYNGGVVANPNGQIFWTGIPN